jgi:hypothetical protein
MAKARKMSSKHQFDAWEDRNWINKEINDQVRGFGWSRDTILTRMGIVDGDRELLDIPIDEPEGIFIFGHCVKTQADNICERCSGDITGGEIVLGVVIPGYSTSHRYYLCSSCLLELSEKSDMLLDPNRLKTLREQVKEYNRKNK